MTMRTLTICFISCIFCMLQTAQSFSLLKNSNNVFISKQNMINLRAVNPKVSNFQDSDVECTSEGGKWKIPLSTVTSESNLVISTLTAKDFPAIEQWSDTLKVLTTCITTKADAEGITKLCDQLDSTNPNHSRTKLFLNFFINQKMAELLRRDRFAYVATANFLSPSRIPRKNLPNVQVLASDSAGLECTLPPITYSESGLDIFLLKIFRGIVQKETGGYKSSIEGIKGLLDEGRTYKLSPEGSDENQHAFVQRTLGTLATPLLPPFYRIFMAGIVPSIERGDPSWLVDGVQKLNSALPGTPLTEGKQLGPWPYAPLLTAIVTPPFLSFLVGPSRPNYRQDGQLGGLVVEKCKFLQESGCKGLCLHQCKIPAQNFFQETLGVPLTVQPNFATQECQWSWGQAPLPHQSDPAWPKGCLSGCADKVVS